VASQGLDRAVDARAKQALDKGDFQAAERLYREAMRLSPKKVDWPVGLGLTLERQARFEEALAAYRKAAELSPGEAEYANPIRVLIAEGKLEDAETSTRDDLKTWPSDANLRALSGPSSQAAQVGGCAD
jgi:Flp pilus assembly protein TadD